MSQAGLAKGRLDPKRSQAAAAQGCSISGGAVHPLLGSASGYRSHAACKPDLGAEERKQPFFQHSLLRPLIFPMAVFSRSRERSVRVYKYRADPFSQTC